MKNLSFRAFTAGLEFNFSRRLRDCDRDIYGLRYEVGNLFAELNDFRVTTTRHDKTSVGFAAAVQLITRLMNAQ